MTDNPRSAIWQIGLARLSGWILPYRCVVCALPAERLQDLCLDCELRLPWLKGVCEHCQESLPAGSSKPICAACIVKPPAFDRMVSLFEYDFPVNALVQGLKFSDRTSFARVFGELMAKHLEELFISQALPKPQVIVPVPLHKARLYERGFNQAEFIAVHVRSKLGVPMRADLVLRTKSTEAQSSLGLDDRRHNVKQAFHLKKAMPYRHVAILDDVVTSGNTVAELAKVLKQAGAETVQVWSVCKALSRK